MQFESFEIMEVKFEYKAYVGVSMMYRGQSSGMSGIAPYGFFNLNSLTATQFEIICKDILNADLSANQRVIIGRCLEECQKVVNENSLQYWKSKWFEENQRAAKIQEQYFQEVGSLRADLLYMEDRLNKAQKKIVFLKRR